jgi:hypothetical protein
MTSIAAESVSTILVSCKQTRFHIESPNYREVKLSRPIEKHIERVPPLTSNSLTLKASTSL